MHVPNVHKKDRVQVKKTKQKKTLGIYYLLQAHFHFQVVCILTKNADLDSNYTWLTSL